MKNCADREGSFWALIRLFRRAIAYEMLCCFVELAVPTETAEFPHCSPLVTLVVRYFFNYCVINSSKFG